MGSYMNEFRWIPPRITRSRPWASPVQLRHASCCCDAGEQISSRSRGLHRLDGDALWSACTSTSSPSCSAAWSQHRPYLYGQHFPHFWISVFMCKLPVGYLALPDCQFTPSQASRCTRTGTRLCEHAFQSVNGLVVLYVRMRQRHPGSTAPLTQTWLRNRFMSAASSRT